MKLPNPPGGWKPFLWRCIPLIAVLLFPWSGLGTAFSGAMAGVCEAAVSLVSGSDSEIHFVPRHYEGHPWWVQVSVKNVFTSESFSVPLDTRTVAYIRIVVFFSLAVAWPFWATRGEMKATAWGFALLIGLIALSVVLPLLQVLGMVKTLTLGVLTQSLLSIGILMLLTYPSMAFAVPALIWLLTLRLAREGSSRSPGAALAPIRASRSG